MIDNMAAARRWREQWGYICRGDIIVLFDGEVQSWVNQLRTLSIGNKAASQLMREAKAGLPSLPISVMAL